MVFSGAVTINGTTMNLNRASAMNWDCEAFFEAFVVVYETKT